MRLLYRIRLLFWPISISSWHMWKYLARHGPRVQIFRNRRYPDGSRMYKMYRWGFAILGFEFGDRGGRKQWLRERLEAKEAKR